MIVKLEENPSLEELEVCIRYATMNETVHKLEALVRGVNKTVQCHLENTQLWIPASDIYYIESVDKHTFVYCQNAVYDCDSRLYQLISELKDTYFVQVSKSCLVNLQFLKQIKPLFNSRLEATLSNGERITVTRKYIPSIREKLKRREE